MGWWGSAFEVEMEGSSSEEYVSADEGPGGESQETAPWVNLNRIPNNTHHNKCFTIIVQYFTTSE